MEKSIKLKFAAWIDTTISCGAVKKTNQYIDIKQLTRAFMRVIMNVLAIERYVRVLSAWIFQRIFTGNSPFCAQKR